MFQIYDIFEPSEESKPTANGRDSHGSTLTEMPDEHIMVAWYQGPYKKVISAAIYTSTVDPTSEEWTPVVLLEKESQIKGEGNPVLFYDSETKRLWLFWATLDRADYKHVPGGWSTCKIKCKSSEDLGKAWSPPKWLTHFWGRMTAIKPFDYRTGKCSYRSIRNGCDTALIFTSQVEQSSLKGRLNAIGNILLVSAIKFSNQMLLNLSPDICYAICAPRSKRLLENGFLLVKVRISEDIGLQSLKALFLIAIQGLD